MTFFALLTKELRLRMRRERTMWVIIVYILLMGFLGWFFISRFSTTSSYGPFSLENTGVSLYTLLSQIQLFLIMFITPAFTATAINGEKERQTFDLLLCSRLSAFSLVAGKLVAGLANALLLVAASIPLFSLVFFFGGISPTQVLTALVVYTTTAVMIGACGLFFSTVLSRPAVSTAVTYMAGVIWLLMPLAIYFILLASGSLQNTTQPPNLFIWNPVVALLSTYTVGSSFYFTIGGILISPWGAYTVLNLVTATIFFALSMWTVKPRPPIGLSRGNRKKPQNKTPAAA
jgi:ABC-type transport system involved in multi-copper enzyme maturation permease subunit